MHYLLTPWHSRGKLYRKFNLPAKASAASIAFSVISKSAALFFTPFFTRLLTPGEYGSYSLFFSYLSVIMIFATLDICTGVFFRACQKYRGQEGRLMRSALLLICFSSILTLFIFFLYNRLSGKGEIFRGSNILLIASVFLSAVINLYLAKNKFLYRFKFPAIVCGLQSLFAPVISLITLSFYASDGANRVFIKVADGLLVTAAVAIPTLFIILFSDGVRELFRPSLSMIKYLLRLSLPLLPYYVSMLLISSADRIIIGSLLSLEALGQYSLAYSLGFAVPGLILAACQAISPWIMRKVAAGELEKIKKVCSAATNLSAICSLAFLCLAPEFMKIMGPASYEGGIFSVYPIAACSVPLLLASLNASLTISEEKILPLSLTGVGTCVLYIALSLIFIPKFGTGAGAVITLISYSLLFFVGSFVCKSRAFSALPIGSSLCKTLALASAAGLLYLVRDLLALRLALIVLLMFLFSVALYKNRFLLSDKT